LTLADISETLAAASRDRRRVAIDGGGTKREWGSLAPAADVTISTRGLNTVIAHRYGDLTATVEAGASLADVNRVLATHGQWIPLDPPHADRATIGGIVATNDSGPRRHRFGAPRDLIIGVEIVRVDGTRAKSGGIVVKNVAGYDLGRLMTGSFGSLALIAQATFKLYPIAPASRSVVVDMDDSGVAERTIAAISGSHLTPTALELQAKPLRLLVRFESIAAAADEQAAALVRLATTDGARAFVVDTAEESALWDAHDARLWQHPGAIIKISCLPTEVMPTMIAIGESLRDVEWDAIGRAGVGVLLLRVGANSARQARIITDLRARFPHGRGSVVIVRGSDELKQSVDAWGAPGDALPLMRAIKRQFDPHALLNTGRGPFGL